MGALKNMPSDILLVESITKYLELSFFESEEVWCASLALWKSGVVIFR
jgi:hypothetical protein